MESKENPAELKVMLLLQKTKPTTNDFDLKIKMHNQKKSQVSGK